MLTCAANSADDVRWLMMCTADWITKTRVIIWLALYRSLTCQIIVPRRYVRTVRTATCQLPIGPLRISYPVLTSAVRMMPSSVYPPSTKSTATLTADNSRVRCWILTKRTPSESSRRALRDDVDFIDFWWRHFFHLLDAPDPSLTKGLTGHNSCKRTPFRSVRVALEPGSWDLSDGADSGEKRDTSIFTAKCPPDHKHSPSMTQKIWLNRLPQYMVPSVHYCPELVNAAIDHFNPRTSTIEGQTLMVNIILGAIWNMLCIPKQSCRKEEIEIFTLAKGENICKGMQKALDFYNK